MAIKETRPSPKPDVVLISKANCLFHCDLIHYLSLPMFIMQTFGQSTPQKVLFGSSQNHLNFNKMQQIPAIKKPLTETCEAKLLCYSKLDWQGLHILSLREKLQEEGIKVTLVNEI